MKFFVVISVVLWISSRSIYAEDSTFKNSIYPLIKESETYKNLFKNFTFEAEVTENRDNGNHTIQVFAVQADRPYKNGHWGKVLSQYSVVFTITSETSGKNSISKVELTNFPGLRVNRPRPYELVSVSEKGELKVHKFANQSAGMDLEVLDENR